MNIVMSNDAAFVVMDVNFYRDKLVLSDHISTDTYQLTTEDAGKKVFQERFGMKNGWWKQSHSAQE